MKYRALTIGDICEFRYGRSLPQRDRDSGAVIVYGSNGPVGSHSEAVSDGKTVVVGRKGSQGEVHYSADSCFPIDTTYYIDRTCTDEHIRWLYYALKQARLPLLNRAAAVPGLNRNDAYERLVLVPPLPEQERIVAILDKSDTIRCKRRETMRLLDDFLRSVFLDMFGEDLYRDTDTVFGDMLEEPLANGYFAKNDIYGEGAPVVWVDNLYHTMSIKTDGLRRARLTAADLDKYAVRDGDLLFTRSSLVAEGVGQVNIVPVLNEPTAFECHIIRARVDRRKLNPFYVLGLYRSAFGKQHILRNANTATMTTISQSAIERLPCPVPPLHLQNDFETIVRKTGSARSSLERASYVDEELMGCLMQRAFKGEI